MRRVGNKVFARYAFEFFQGDKRVYSGEQAAMWLNASAEPGALEGDKL